MKKSLKKLTKKQITKKAAVKGGDGGGWRNVGIMHR